jgi:hypothetical protein
MNQDGTSHDLSDLFCYPPRTKLDLNKAVQELAQLRQHDHRHHNINVILDLDRELPETTADGEQIECVLLALFARARNAIIDAKKTHGSIAVRTGLKAGNIQFSITDDGRPVFKPEESITLTTCAEIVQDQEGELYAWRPGHRAMTTIVMDLPVLIIPVPRKWSTPLTSIDNAEAWSFQPLRKGFHYGQHYSSRR